MMTNPEIPGLERISLKVAAINAVKAGPMVYVGPQIFDNARSNIRIRDQQNQCLCPKCGFRKAVREAPCFNLTKNIQEQFIRCPVCRKDTKLI